LSQFYILTDYLTIITFLCIFSNCSNGLLSRRTPSSVARVSASEDEPTTRVHCNVCYAPIQK